MPLSTSHCEFLKEEAFILFLPRRRLLEWGGSKRSLKTLPRHKDTVGITCAPSKQFFLSSVAAFPSAYPQLNVEKGILRSTEAFCTSYGVLIWFCAAAKFILFQLGVKVQSVMSLCIGVYHVPFSKGEVVFLYSGTAVSSYPKSHALLKQCNLFSKSTCQLLPASKAKQSDL